MSNANYQNAVNETTGEYLFRSDSGGGSDGPDARGFRVKNSHGSTVLRVTVGGIHTKATAYATGQEYSTLAAGEERTFWAPYNAGIKWVYAIAVTSAGQADHDVLSK